MSRGVLFAAEKKFRFNKKISKSSFNYYNIHKHTYIYMYLSLPNIVFFLFYDIQHPFGNGFNTTKAMSIYDNYKNQIIHLVIKNDFNIRKG